MISLNLSRKLFNPVYWHLERALNDETLRYIWLFGGSSGSKTYSFCQNIVKRMCETKDDNSLFMRKYGSDIEDSIYADVKSIISKWKLSDYFIIQKNYIECIATGTYISFRGLDDPEKVKGVSQYRRIVLEEVSQFTEADLKQVRKRLRGKTGQQIIGIFNPISEDHWLKKTIFDKEGFTELPNDISGMWKNAAGNALALRSNYINNHFIVGPQFIDKHVIDDFERDKVEDYNYYLIYALGEWGKLRTGGEFWKNFKYDLHVDATATWDESLPIHLTWDDNVNPFLTCLVWQGRGGDLKQIDEICLEDPRNRVYDTCKEFMMRYPLDRVQGLFIYGDRTAMKEDTKLAKGENFYTKVLEYLAAYKPRLRMQTANPSVVMSAGFVNEIYAGRIEGASITINPRCTKSINDYQYALEDSDGTLKKVKKTHPVTKVSYEEYGHPSDAKRYLVVYYHREAYLNYLKGGKRTKIMTGGPSKNKF